MFKLLTEDNVIKTCTTLPELAEISRGDVAQLTEYNNQVFAVKSNGSSPIGIVEKKVKIVKKKSRKIKRHAVKIIYNRCLIQTDNYDVNESYPLGANLFINNHGQFTTRQPSSKNYTVGMVTGSPTAENKNLQLMWF